MRLRALVALLCVFLASPASAGSNPPAVLATIKPIHSLVAAVMEGTGTPQLLIGGAVSEHSYVLKPSDARKIAAADIVFWIGPNLETFLITPLASLAGHAKAVALQDAKGVLRLAARPGGLWHAPAGEAADSHINPHIWLDPQNAIAMTQTIAETLAKADPARAAHYQANAAAEIGRLKALDSRIARTLAPIRTRPYIVFHDAYPYFEAHYRLNAIGAVTVEPDRPAGPRRVAELHDALKEGRALCIFREPQFPPALIETLAAGTRARIGVLDPLGADLPAGSDLYPMLMNALAANLVRCLTARAP